MENYPVKWHIAFEDRTHSQATCIGINGRKALFEAAATQRLAESTRTRT